MTHRLYRANVPDHQRVGSLLVWASWHLDTAQFGWDILQRSWPDGDRNFTGHPMITVEIAAEDLIFGGIVSAMDLCAAAVFRLTGEHYRADRERNVVWWFRGTPPAWKLVPAPLVRWLRVFDGNSTWEMARGLRDPFTHRNLGRDVTLTIGGRDHGSIEFVTPSGRYDAEDSMSKLIGFGKRRFSSFERELARSYRLR